MTTGDEYDEAFLPVEYETRSTALGWLLGIAAVLLIVCAPAVVWAVYGWAF